MTAASTELSRTTPDQVWAMLPRTADALARNPGATVTPTAAEITAFLTGRGFARAPGADLAVVHAGVGVLPVFGPVLSRRHWQSLALDFGALLDAPEVRAIVLDFDTPGGIVTGVQEFADLIFASRGRKPITAFIAGMGASAGYWLASAADEVVIAETGEAGSIGVAALYIDFSKFDEKMGIQEIEIISSQSPNKNADPATNKGLALVQTRVDALADVFIDRVAKQRRTTRENVLANFGRGDLLVGRRAVTAGLADRIGTFESVIADQAPAAFEARRAAAAAIAAAPPAAARPPAQPAPPATGSRRQTLPTPGARASWEHVEARIKAERTPGAAMPAAPGAAKPAARAASSWDRVVAAVRPAKPRAGSSWDSAVSKHQHPED